MAVTMKDIAKVAKVDPSAISAVLHGSRTIRVSEKKRAEILALAESMGYRPNLIARGLITKKSYTVGLLFFSIKDRFYASLMAELQVQLQKLGYAGIYASWDSGESVKNAYDVVLSHKVDGIITCHNDPALLPSQTPTVIFEMLHEQYDSVSLNHEKAAMDSMNYLRSLGHKKIGYVGRFSDPVYSTYLRLMQEWGLEIKAQWSTESTGFMGDALNAAENLLKSNDRPTALLARNDVVAMAILNAARKQGLSVPEELSVIGIDNIEDSAYCYPALTTNGVDMKFLAEKLLTALFNRINNPDIPQQTLRLDTELVVRESCAELSTGGSN